MGQPRPYRARKLIFRVIQPTTADDGLQDQRDYYYHVIPLDEFGASPENNTVRRFHTDNANPAFPAAS